MPVLFLSVALSTANAFDCVYERGVAPVVCGAVSVRIIVACTLAVDRSFALFKLFIGAAFELRFKRAPISFIASFVALYGVHKIGGSKIEVPAFKSELAHLAHIVERKNRAAA